MIVVEEKYLIPYLKEKYKLLTNNTSNNVKILRYHSRHISKGLNAVSAGTLSTDNETITQQKGVLFFGDVRFRLTREVEFDFIEHFNLNPFKTITPTGSISLQYPHYYFRCFETERKMSLDFKAENVLFSEISAKFNQNALVEYDLDGMLVKFD